MESYQPPHHDQIRPPSPPPPDPQFPHQHHYKCPLPPPSPQSQWTPQPPQQQPAYPAHPHPPFTALSLPPRYPNQDTPMTVMSANILEEGTLTEVISVIFDQASRVPTSCEILADFCQHLASRLPSFRTLLLNKCQEFGRGEREEQEADNAGDKVCTHMLDNIGLIGELYKKEMLPERIMHECIKKLLGQYQKPNEENIEALCKLMSTIGEMIDHPKAKEHMDAYIDRMGQLSNDIKLSSRVEFMLKAVIDLRKNKWQQRRKIEGPKTIEEVHRDGVVERQGQVNPTRRGQPLEFGPPRGSRGGHQPGPARHVLPSPSLTQLSCKKSKRNKGLSARPTLSPPVYPHRALPRSNILQARPIPPSPLAWPGPSQVSPARLGPNPKTAQRRSRFSPPIEAVGDTTWFTNPLFFFKDTPKIEGPKTIEEVPRDGVVERQGQDNPTSRDQPRGGGPSFDDYKDTPKIEGPKTIEEVPRDGVVERQGQDNPTSRDQPRGGGLSFDDYRDKIIAANMEFLNTADQEELLKIQGIGEKKALNILDAQPRLKERKHLSLLDKSLFNESRLLRDMVHSVLDYHARQKKY